MRMAKSQRRILGACIHGVGEGCQLVGRFSLVTQSLPECVMLLIEATPSSFVESSGVSRKLAIASPRIHKVGP